MEKRILILTAGFGEGHNAAARGLRDGLAVVAGKAAVVEVHDIFAETFGFVNNWVRKSYLAIINRAPRAWGRFYEWLDRQENYGGQMGWLFLARARLSHLLLRFQPGVVVSVFPAYPHLIETILGGAVPPFRRVICVTDSITVNAIWYRCQNDLFLVPNEQTGAVLAQAGVPEAQVKVAGFPVAPKFAELGELRNDPVAGRADVGREMEIVGWTDQLPRKMLESHLLVSKAGGATTQETIAARCPMIVNQIVPGQEEGNGRLIEETRSGVIATTPAAIVGAVEAAFADNAKIWREWSANISRLSRPRASLEIAELLLGLGP